LLVVKGSIHETPVAADGFAGPVEPGMGRDQSCGGTTIAHEFALVA
jgi:hypothetical protein